MLNLTISNSQLLQFGSYIGHLYYIYIYEARLKMSTPEMLINADGKLSLSNMTVFMVALFVFQHLI